ncbi:MAG: 3-hydroxyacyl-ACP dehydratase FabZ [Lysobacterales bacterium]|jgi:3-hydroxyacyl-[acyl-carrier-protein] dehydratase
MTDKTITTPMGVNEIREILPHRYPFLLVDRVVSYTLEPEITLTAIKNVTANEPFFTGHFPDNPVMPGVLVLEAMAQASGILAYLNVASLRKGGTNYLVKIDKAKFSRVVVPGDQLLMHITQKRVLRNMGFYECVTTVDGQKVASSDIVSTRG